MLAELEAAVEGLEIGLDGAELARAHNLVDRLSAKVTLADGDFDAAKLWDLDSSTSMTAWLRHFAGMATADAARSVSAGRRLRGLAVTAAAATSGRLSAGQLKAVLANVNDRTAGMFADHEAEVVPSLEELSVASTASAMRWWAARAESRLDDEAPAPEPPSRVSLSKTFRGRYALDGDLDALGGSMLATALRLAEGGDTEGEYRSPAERRADALSTLAGFFLERHDSPAGSRHRPHLNVIVHLEDLLAGGGGELAEGGELDGPTLASLVCDSVLHRVLMSGPSTIVDYGTSTRTISPSVFNALVVRDRHCRFPGCDRPAAWTEAHHVVHVADGGETRLANLGLFCSRHHHRLHQPGWRAEMDPDGELRITDPAGGLLTSSPPTRYRPPPELFATRC